MVWWEERAAMRIRVKKGTNHDTLTCLRDDASNTWATARPGGVEHDLVHYAVETTLGYDRAFYGAVARGRDLQELSAFDPEVGRNRRPTRQAHYAEHLVSLVQADRRGGVLGDVYAALAEARARGAVPPDVTDEEYDAAWEWAAALLCR
jgi:hypothetical protein